MSKQLAVLVFITLCLTAVARAQTQIEATKWRDFDAYRLTDGRSEAIVVPSIGRVMHFGLKGGFNWLWNAPVQAPAQERKANSYQNWGGDKLFIGPHDAWLDFAPSKWPPRLEWDGVSHSVEVANDHLTTNGPVWPGFNIRLRREYSFDSNGDFVIKSTLIKVAGEPVKVAAWNVTQCATPDAVFIPLNPNSPYKNNFFWFGKPKTNVGVTPLSPQLLQIRPVPGAAYKIGADSPPPAIAAVKNGFTFVQRAERKAGQYPDGAAEAGFPIEFYNHSDPGTAHYVELELLSPLTHLQAGDKLDFTVRWSLHLLPSPTLGAATLDSIQQLLRHGTPNYPARDCDC